MRNNFLLLLLYLFVIFVFGIHSVYSFSELKIIANDGYPLDYFGDSVAICDNYAIIGAYGVDDSYNNRRGSAYIYKRDLDSWVYDAKLSPTDSNDDNNDKRSFGSSVFIDNNYAIVGDPGLSISGAVYIFARYSKGWIQTARLLPESSDDMEISSFGGSIFLYDQFLIVGAYYSEINNVQTGAAYVFRRREPNDWYQVCELTPTTIDVQFGRSVSLSENFAAVGVPSSEGIGCVYLFKTDSWASHQILVSDNNSSSFGKSVSIFENYLLVGDPSNSNSHLYEYRNNLWEKIHTFTGISNSQFGRYVSICNNYAIIGAYREKLNESQIGTAYIYQNTNDAWQLLNKTFSHDTFNSTINYGARVFISNNFAIVGASEDNTNGEKSGAAFVYNYKNFQKPFTWDIDNNNKLGLADIIYALQTMTISK